MNDYEITAGRMPNGLKLVDGVIQGTPSEYGYFNFTVRFKDNFYQSSKDYELYVLPDSGEESRLYYEGYQLWYHYNPSEIEHLRTVSSHVKAVNDLQWQQIPVHTLTICSCSAIVRMWKATWPVSSRSEGQAAILAKLAPDAHCGFLKNCPSSSDYSFR